MHGKDNGDNGKAKGRSISAIFFRLAFANYQQQLKAYSQ